MDMRILISILYLFVSISLLGQDIVYDSIYGDQSKWLRIKGGPTEKILKTAFENDAVIKQSKVLSAAGLLNDMEKGVDYVDYTYPYDTITYEFNTDVPINVIVYKYFYNDTLFRYHVGLRKSPLGANMFEGKYLFICPIFALGSEVRIYDGIGTNRREFLRFKPEEMTDNMVADYMLSNQATIQGINVSRVLRASKTRDVLTNIVDIRYEIKFWPNPTSDYFNVQILNNKGVNVRIFDNLPRLIYHKFIQSEDILIDVSSFADGPHIVVISDKKENIIEVLKIIVSK